MIYQWTNQKIDGSFTSSLVKDLILLLFHQWHVTPMRLTLALNMSPGCVDSLTSRSDVCISQICLCHHGAFKSDLRFLLQPLMFGFPLKQAPQHGSSSGLSGASRSGSNGLFELLLNPEDSEIILEIAAPVISYQSNVQWKWCDPPSEEMCPLQKQRMCKCPVYPGQAVHIQLSHCSNASLELNVPAVMPPRRSYNNVLDTFQ